MNDEIDKFLCEADGEIVIEALRKMCGDAVIKYSLDSIHIIATKSERMSDRKTDGGTRVIQAGAGNYYARYGSIREWINKEEDAQRNNFPDIEDDDV